MEKKNKLMPKLDWDVKTQPLITIKGVNTGRRAVLRNDNDSIIGMVGTKYRIYTNRELISLCKSIEKIGAFHSEGFLELRKGKVVMAFLRNNSPGLRLAGLDLKEYLVIGNSHDGSKSLFIGTSQSLIRCENQFYQSVPLTSMMHLKAGIQKKTLIHQLKTSYDQARQQLYRAMETLTKKPIYDESIDDLIAYLLSNDTEVPQGDKRRLILQSYNADALRHGISVETGDLGKNAFGLFNGVTWFTSHVIPQRSRKFGNVSGTSQRLNAKALEFCLEKI